MSLLKHMERWKDIEGYEGLYMVSNCGRVKSLGNSNSNNSKERILKQMKDRYGYIYVNLWKDGDMKHYTVHRLVAKEFIQNPNNYPQVNHKDENKENNYVWNLEWCTQKYNQEYSSGKKILCVETNIIYPSSMEAQRQTGISQSNIISCCKGKYKSAGKLHWKYVN